jgi:hypothetical protein
MMRHESRLTEGVTSSTPDRWPRLQGARVGLGKAGAGQD